MKMAHKTFALTALASAVAATSGYAADTGDEEVDLLINPSSSISLGVGHWSGTREQYGIFDGLRDDETIALFDADIRLRDDDTGTWITAKARNLGIDNRDVKLRYERQGNWGVGFSFNQIPRYAQYTIITGMSGLGTETQAVPAPADGYVPGTGDDVVLDTKREAIGLDFFKYLSPNLNFKVDYRNETKEGDRHWGRGGQAEFAAEPIDSTTRQVDVLLEYAGKEFQLTGGYYGSWFENDNDLVTTFRGLAAPGSQFYLSLPMDNEAHQFYLNGGYNFTPTTRGTFRVSYTHATQNEHLPTSDIPGLAAAIAPSKLDGEINTTLVQLGLTAQPTDMLSLVANLRYHDVDDQTPAWLVVTAGTGVHSTPMSYETISGTLEGTYRLGDGYSVIGGVDYKTQDRSVPQYAAERYVPFRSRVDELTYRAQLRKSLSETVNGALSLSHSDRDGSSFSPAIHSDGLTADSLISPINIADRKRNKVRATVDWAATESLGLQFNAEASRDRYEGPASVDYGLTEGSARLFSVDADYAFNDNWHMAAWASWDRSKATQRNYHDTNIGGLADTDRTAHLTDTGISLGLGLDGKINSRTKVGADIEWTRTTSEYDDNIPPAYYLANVSPLDDIVNRSTKISLFADYAIDKQSALRFDVVHEIWKSDDWTWQFSDGSPFVYGTTNDGTMVVYDPSQSATFVGLRYKYTFM